LSQQVLITGGAGFIGSHLADLLLASGYRVRVLDDLSPQVHSSGSSPPAYLSPEVEFIYGDLRDREVVRRSLVGVDAVYHLAAQVAVTTSLADPVRDFEVNAWGTLNLLEAIRARGGAEPILFTSTNKVYGGLTDLELSRTGSRYEPVDPGYRSAGVSEDRPIELHSPYGCSKGAAEQYVLDYARSYGLPTVVFRMSCIYGPHQFGAEDQGWIAHFLIRALDGESITLYGDGHQVRDTLYVGDLVDAFLLVLDGSDELGSDDL